MSAHVPASIHLAGIALAALAPSPAAQTWTTGNPVQPARTLAAVTSAGGKAFFGGGGHPFVGYHDTVNVYDSSLGAPSDPAAWSLATLSLARANLAATSVGGKVLFAGGNHQGFNLPASDVVDVYDPVLGPPSDPAAWSVEHLSEPRWADTATSVAGYALFAGGYPHVYGDFPCAAPSDTVDVYEAATGLWSQGTLAVPRVVMRATSVGPYAFFAGGQVCTFGPASDAVEVYDATVGPPADPAAWSVASLSQARTLGAAVSAGGRAYFAGGVAEVTTGVFENVDTVDVYDSCIGPPSDPAAWSVRHLSAPRILLAATSQGSEALFAGGQNTDTGVYFDTVDVFDAATGTQRVEHLSVPRLPLATSAGSFALFAGGHDEGWVWTPHDVVDARQAASGHWYVDLAAAGPGDGTVENPFPTIQAGIDAAGPGERRSSPRRRRVCGSVPGRGRGPGDLGRGRRARSLVGRVGPQRQALPRREPRGLQPGQGRVQRGRPLARVAGEGQARRRARRTHRRTGLDRLERME
jgi:hypothetical protein